MCKQPGKFNPRNVYIQALTLAVLGVFPGITRVVTLVLPPCVPRLICKSRVINSSVCVVLGGCGVCVCVCVCVVHVAEFACMSLNSGACCVLFVGVSLFRDVCDSCVVPLLKKRDRRIPMLSPFYRRPVLHLSNFNCSYFPNCCVA